MQGLRVPFGERGRRRTGAGRRWTGWAAIVAVGVGLLVAAAFGAPLVSILLVGLALLCPLLMWAPFHEHQEGTRAPQDTDHRESA